VQARQGIHIKKEHTEERANATYSLRAKTELVMETGKKIKSEKEEGLKPKRRGGTVGGERVKPVVEEASRSWWRSKSQGDLRLNAQKNPTHTIRQKEGGKARGIIGRKRGKEKQWSEGN